MTPEARTARERKQKIFVVVGGLLLLAMLAFQLPKMLGGSSSDAAAAGVETTLPGQPIASPQVATPVAVVGAASSSSTAGKLRSFTLFAAKDPFVQQVVTDSPVADAAGAGAPSGGGEKATTPPTKFATGTSAAAAVTIVTVNGARQVLEPGMKFPSSDPLFVLIAEKPDSKSVVVGVVGGAYAGGGKTTTLKVGKPVTLVNTTTGARYKISLVSVGSGDDAAPAAASP